MLKRPHRLRFLVALAAILLLAQGPLWWPPAAHAQEDKVTWDRPTAIKRAAPKRGRIRRPVVRRGPRKPVEKPVEEAPLLTMQWRVMKVNTDGTQNETNPGATFYPGDRLRLAVKVNQPGYLTIIHQSAPDQDGAIIFPDSRINGGQNYVKKNEEFTIPSLCPAGIKPSDCALVVAGPAGRELFTLIFSRDLISDLTLKATQGALKPQLLQQLKAESGQILKRGQGIGTGPYTIWVANTNVQDNEEIIETLVLNKGAQSATTP